MCGAIPPLSQYTFMAWCSEKKSTGTSLPFYLLRHEDVLRIGGISPRSLNLDFRGKWSTLLLYPFGRRLDGPQNQSGGGGEEKKLSGPCR
jgi:hypothetical protein